MAVNMHLKKRSKLGVKGLAPLGCLPLWGREGVTLAIAQSALREGFLQSRFLKSGRYFGRMFLFLVNYYRAKKYREKR
jgi:hypothetical protein